MGSSTSKAASRAAASVQRKYPTSPSSQRAPPIKTPTSRPPPPRQPGPSVHPTTPSASSTRDQTINLDASDPDFVASLRSLGAVQPSPTFSPSSRFGDVLRNKTSQTRRGVGGGGEEDGRGTGTATEAAYAAQAARMTQGGPPLSPATAVKRNPALGIVDARRKFADVAEEEMATRRSLVDANTIRQILTLRDERGLEDGKIEDMLELKPGTVRKLGRKGLVEAGQLGVLG